jgi:hypothetical protein
MDIAKFTEIITASGYEVSHRDIEMNGIYKVKITSNTYYTEFLITEEALSYCRLKYQKEIQEFLSKITKAYNEWEKSKLGVILPTITEGNYTNYF